MRWITKAFYIYVVLFMAGCTRPEGQSDIPSEAVLENEKNSEEESEKEAKEEGEIYVEEESEMEGTEDAGSMYQNYSYGISLSQLEYVASVLGLDFEKPEGVDSVPILEVSVPNYPERAERINKAIAEQCIRLLPMDDKWLRNVEMQVVYRSDRYLCYEYVSRTDLPDGYADISLPLYITVDLKREKTIDYPFETVKNGDRTWKYRLDDVDEEREEYIKKPVEEQDRMREETGYNLCQEMWKCENGISVPCIQVKGMGDEEKQERVNRVLREPLEIVAEEEKDSSKVQSLTKRFCEAEIYVAYKSEQWLSVEYSVRLPESWTWKGNEDIVHFGVTVDMYTGEQVMLDDLFDMQGFIEWECTNRGGSYELDLQRILERAVRPEKEIIEELKNTQKAEGAYSILSYMSLTQSFYLCRGRIVLFHGGIPLQDVSQYLKVDPWYD